jgi:hypothetical protein
MRDNPSVPQAIGFVSQVLKRDIHRILRDQLKGLGRTAKHRGEDRLSYEA